MKSQDKKVIEAFEKQKHKLKNVDFTNYSIWVSTTDDLIKKHLGETSSQRAGLLNLFDTTLFNPKDHHILIKQRVQTAEGLIDDCIACYRHNLPLALDDLQMIQSFIKKCQKIPTEPDIYESDFTFSGNPEKRIRFLKAYEQVADIKRDLRAYIVVKMAGRGEYLKICDEISFAMPFKTIAPEVVPLEFHQYKANLEHWAVEKGKLLNLLKDIEAETKMGLGNQPDKIIEREKSGPLELVKKYSLSAVILTAVFFAGKLAEFLVNRTEVDAMKKENKELKNANDLLTTRLDSLMNQRRNSEAAKDTSSKEY